jgi:hypothetical protein
MTSHPINVSSKWHHNVTINVLPHKHCSNSQFYQKPHEHYKCPALSLVLAISRSIYYLLNGTFNQAYDVNHLINRLLLMLQRYITRHNDFQHRWFTLLLSGLLRSRLISLWFLIVLFLRIYVVASGWTLVWYPKTIYNVNMIVYAANSIIDKIVAQYSYLHFLCFSIRQKNILHNHPLILKPSYQNIKPSSSFVGGG